MIGSRSEDYLCCRDGYCCNPLWGVDVRLSYERRHFGVLVRNRDLSCSLCRTDCYVDDQKTFDEILAQLRRMPY